MAGRGGRGNCGDECSKKSGWAPVVYSIIYIVSGYTGMGNWEIVRKVKILENITNEKQAKMVAKRWLRSMKMGSKDGFFKLKSAELVASTHKDILKLTP